jgi:ubiquinone/menaquinone biosynthesis C-methylase UbiE
MIDPRDRFSAGADLYHRYRGGTATETGLAEASSDLVTVAQAFHWFDVPAALAEFRRILATPGWCAAFWNLRRPSLFMDSSYVIHGVAEPAAFDRALGELFDCHQSGGTVEFPYRTVAVCCRLR